ncbi:MAG: hypothetical protein M1825_002277 [Sarcosagium campestre]|nr:MAG: hypothetical protein M1825_002277 [Sarcosagium campestre]
MSTSTMPQIPPRPAQTQKGLSPNAQSSAIPVIPPRPIRRSDRSQSPSRDSYARSPLNETGFVGSYGNKGNGGQPGLFKNSENLSTSSLPQRPPSVTLPSIGQEGSEYGSFYEDETPAPDGPRPTSTVPNETRSVDSALKLHAPKPALPISSARSKIATVTRTDSNQAAAVGIGGNASDDKDPQSRSLKSKTSVISQNSSASTERPSSAQPGENEQGIPEIGRRVPMYPNAGDVQAPSPSPYAPTPFPSGIGFHNDGQHKPGRHHGRTRSGMEHFLPPGSYGLHGHGTPAHDRFEKDWYEKHPDALVREGQGEYGPGLGNGRGGFALSSDDLNKLVRETASRGSGAGTTAAVAGTPSEQIGYIASQEFATRIASSRTPSVSLNNKAHSNHSQTNIESPLREGNFPADVAAAEALESSKSGIKGQLAENAVESEAEDDVIHVDQPSYRSSKITGGGYDPPTEDLGPHGGNTSEEGGWIDETGYGAPILASDEVAKVPGAEFMQPAISPAQERRGSDYVPNLDAEHSSSYVSGFLHGGSRGSSAAGSRPTSRPTSRPGSIHGGLSGIARFTSHDEREESGTPLEDVEEYEPLFPEGDESAQSKLAEGKPLSKADKIRIFKHRFPSKDIWEDAPSSAQLMATVSTPELPLDGSQVLDAAKAKEADKDAKAATAAGDKESVNFKKTEQSLHRPGPAAKSHFKQSLVDEMAVRPGARQRFPSRDIWEDTPASLQLQTTVGAPQIDQSSNPPKEPDRPTTGAVTRALDGAAADQEVTQESSRATTTFAPTLDKASKPAIPARPARTKSDDKLEKADKADEASERPAVPARPPRRQNQGPQVDTNIGTATADVKSPKPQSSSTDSKSESFSSPDAERRPPLPPGRPKPQIPTRPARNVTRDSNESIPLSKTVSGASGASIGSGSEDTSSAKDVATPPAPKPKPAIPARALGGKIASLKAGFLSDLDKRLQVGPQGPKTSDKAQEAKNEAEEKESIPLVDARKGRARGPARRAPAASPSGAGQAREGGNAVRCELASAVTVWSISDGGDLSVGSTPAASNDTLSPVKKAVDSESRSSLADESQDEHAGTSQTVVAQTPEEPLPGSVADETDLAVKAAVPKDQENTKLAAPAGADSTQSEEAQVDSSTLAAVNLDSTNQEGHIAKPEVSQAETSTLPAGNPSESEVPKSSEPAAATGVKQEATSGE